MRGGKKMAYSSNIYGGGGIHTSPTQNKYQEFMELFQQLMGNGWTPQEPTPNIGAPMEQLGELPKPSTPQTSYGGLDKISAGIDNQDALANLGITYSPFR